MFPGVHIGLKWIIFNLFCLRRRWWEVFTKTTAPSPVSPTLSLPPFSPWTQLSWQKNKWAASAGSNNVVFSFIFKFVIPLITYQCLVLFAFMLCNPISLTLVQFCSFVCDPSTRTHLLIWKWEIDIKRNETKHGILAVALYCVFHYYNRLFFLSHLKNIFNSD